MILNKMMFSREVMIVKKYRIWASYTNYCYLDVEAVDEEQALAIAAEKDGGDYTPCISYDDYGGWNIDEVEELK